MCIRDRVLEDLKRRFPNEPEYHQAVEEVLSTIEEEYNKHPEFDKANLIERCLLYTSTSIVHLSPNLLSTSRTGQASIR